MQVPLLDLKAQYASIKEEIDAALAEVIASQYFILGPKVAECESLVADYCRSKYAVGVSSGTDALIISLMAAGLGPGDEVITSPYSFFATVGSIVRVGATPVFVDVDPDTYNIDASVISEKLTERTRCILPVHLYGQLAEMTPIMTIAEKHELIVIEDAAQAIGAEHKGQRAGEFGELGCFSFFPSKNLGGFGDGGIVTTSSERLAETMRSLRAHGAKQKYYHKLVGGNFRLDALQAAVVVVKLGHLDTWTAQRQANAARYDNLLESAGLVAGDLVRSPVRRTDRHIYNQYVIRVSRRDELRYFLKQNGISTEVYYPVPLHLQECFQSLGHCQGDFPHSESAAQETLALPIYPELTDSMAEYVIEKIVEFFAAQLRKQGTIDSRITREE